MSGRHAWRQAEPQREITPWTELLSMSWLERVLLVAGAAVVVLGGWIVVAVAIVAGS